MYTNGTTNYNLPQYVDSDKATWTDVNAPFNAIDAAIKGAVDDTAQEALDIDALKARMDTAEQNIGTNTTNIAGLDTRLTTAEGAITSQASQIADVKQDTEDMICAYNEASATSTHRYEIGDYFIYNDVLYKATHVIAIGDTIVPDTNCSTTNVTTELLANVDLSDDVQQLQTDVEQLQSDVVTVNSKVSKVVKSFTANNNTAIEVITDLLSDTSIFDTNKLYYLQQLDSNNNLVELYMLHELNLSNNNIEFITTRFEPDPDTGTNAFFRIRGFNRRNTQYSYIKCDMTMGFGSPTTVTTHAVSGASERFTGTFNLVETSINPATP